MTRRQPAATIADLLAIAAERWPERDAIVFTEGRCTYAELLARAHGVGRALVGLGVRPGSHVGVLMANSPEFVATIFGAALVGAVLVPINTRYRSVELPHVIQDAGIEVALTCTRTDSHVSLVDLLLEALASQPMPALRAIVAFGAEDRPGVIGETTFLANAKEAEPAAVLTESTALILYTSGTTSQPSGCVLTHATLLRSWSKVGAIIGIAPGESCWAPAPLFHITGIGPLLFCIGAGATYVSDTYFDAARALDLITTLQPAVLWPAYPPIIKAMTALTGFCATTLASARLMLAVAPYETMRDLQAAFGHIRLISLYGSTETTVPTLTRPDEPEETRLATCGRPIDEAVEIRIRDLGSDDDAPAGVAGEILVRGSGLFDAYFGNPVKTSAAFDPYGWFRTGDLGAVDTDGRLRFAGRLKEMLKVGGENVAPAEVEAHLGTHPAVKLVQVVGIPDERLGEVPVAFVELLPGTDASEAELIGHCTGRLARFKIPRHIRFTTDWPMSASKIRKAPLVERFLAEAAT